MCDDDEFHADNVIMKIWGLPKPLVHSLWNHPWKCLVVLVPAPIECRDVVLPLRGLWFSTADLPIGLETQMMRVFLLGGGEFQLDDCYC